ncbi:MAG: hypothetical protein ACE5EO_02450 [Candidatus Krumholzibacteriia bacterium]
MREKSFLNPLVVLCLISLFVVFMGCSSEPGTTETDTVVAPATNPPVIITQAGDVNNGAAGERRELTKAELHAKIRSFAPNVQSMDKASQVVTCEVQDPNGVSVFNIPPANFGSQSYWLRYNSGGSVATQVTFAIIPLFTGSPLGIALQQFTFPPPGDITDIVTPFGVPFWGSNLTSGPWALVVANDLGEFSVCGFVIGP